MEKAILGLGSLVIKTLVRMWSTDGAADTNENIIDYLEKLGANFIETKEIATRFKIWKFNYQKS